MKLNLFYGKRNAAYNWRLFYYKIISVSIFLLFAKNNFLSRAISVNKFRSNSVLYLQY